MMFAFQHWKIFCVRLHIGKVKFTFKNLERIMNTANVMPSFKFTSEKNWNNVTIKSRRAVIFGNVFAHAVICNKKINKLAQMLSGCRF